MWILKSTVHLWSAKVSNHVLYKYQPSSGQSSYLLMKTSCLRLKLVELNFFASFTTDDQNNFNISNTSKSSKWTFSIARLKFKKTTNCPLLEGVYFNIYLGQKGPFCTLNTPHKLQPLDPSPANVQMRMDHCYVMLCQWANDPWSVLLIYIRFYAYACFLIGAKYCLI